MRVSRPVFEAFRVRWQAVRKISLFTIKAVTVDNPLAAYSPLPLRKPTQN